MKKLSYLLLFLVFLAACNGSKGKTDTQQNNVKYKTYHNDRYDYTLEYPDFLIPQGEATNQDGQKFFSEDQKTQLLVYREHKLDFNSDGEILPIGKAYEEDLKLKEGIFNKKIEDRHYIIEYKADSLLHTDYATLNGDSYFNIRFKYPEKEKEMMKSVIEYVISSFKMEVTDAKGSEPEGKASAGGEEDKFLPFIEGFLRDCYWGKNFNSLLRNNDKTLATYLDPKMDVRRYYAPGTVTKLGTRAEDFGFSLEDDFMTRPRATSDLIFEYVNDNGSPCELIYSDINSEIYLIYYVQVQNVPDVVVNMETFEIKPVKIYYPKAEVMAVYLPDKYGNPRGFYFINAPDGWKLAFVDDALCGA